MRYSTEYRDQIHVKGYGFLSCTKNMGKSLTSNYVKKLLDSTKESATLETKTSSKRYIKRQKQKVI